MERKKKEQIIHHILQSNNFYDVLFLDLNCSQEDIKKSYRKLAIEIHPDRCTDKNATEAFQKLSHAYQIISDNEKRSKYDINQYNDDFDSNISAEEIFKMFFKNEMQKGPNDNKWRLNVEKEFIIQIISIVVFLFLSLFTALQYMKSKKYNKISESIAFEDFDIQDYIILTSEKYGFTYGIKKNLFSSKDEQNNRILIDEAKNVADNVFINDLKHKCDIEKKFKLDYTPKCDEYNKLIDYHPDI